MCVVRVLVAGVISDESAWKCEVLVLVSQRCLRNLRILGEELCSVRDQGVELAVAFGVEVVYRQQGVTTIGSKQPLAYEIAIGCSDA